MEVGSFSRCGAVKLCANPFTKEIGYFLGSINAWDYSK